MKILLNQVFSKMNLFVYQIEIFIFLSAYHNHIDLSSKNQYYHNIQQYLVVCVILNVCQQERRSNSCITRRQHRRKFQTIKNYDFTYTWIIRIHLQGDQCKVIFSFNLKEIFFVNIRI
jgi:hypothetical protein